MHKILLQRLTNTLDIFTTNVQVCHKSENVTLNENEYHIG